MKLFYFLILQMVISLNVYGQIPHVNEGSLKIVGKDTLQVDANSGDIIEAVFAIKNNHNDTLRIHQILSQCICFQYAYPEEGIAAGQTDSIRLFFMTKHVPPGPYFKRLFADYEGGSLEMIMTGNIKVIRPIYRKGEKPVIYKPVQRTIRNN